MMGVGRTVGSGLIGLALIIGALVIPSPAAAFSYRFSYSGAVTIKITDFTDSELYANGTTCVGVAACDAAATPGPPPLSPISTLTGEDSWAVFKVTSILTGQVGPAGQPIGTTLWADGDNGEQLSGILYGIQDIKVTIAADGSTGTIDSAGVTATGFDTGINIKVFLDSVTPYNPGPGPLARIGQSGYPTITDGTLFLSAHFVPGVTGPTDDPTTLIREILTGNAPFVSTGTGFANVDGGSFATQFDTNSLTTNQGTTADLQINFRANALGSPGTPTAAQVCGPAGAATCWTTASDDPIRASIIPQPMTLTLLGAALMALAGFGWLRKRV